MTERLQKAIAQAGVASRRMAEKMIKTGQVTVNGKIVTQMGVQVEPSDKIEVNGVPISKEQLHTYLLYKPRGYVSTAKDDKGRKTVLDFFTELPYRLYPVGRLDYDTSGALLMTNDGELANALMHPRNEVEKLYTAKVEGLVSSEELLQLHKGVIVDGRKTARALTQLISTDKEKRTSIVSLLIHEGRYHQVKKMFAKVGHPVLKLSRERYAFLDIHSLQPGQFRELNRKEVAQLRGLAVK